MKEELAVISDFIKANYKVLSAHTRRKMIEAGGSEHVSQLGKQGIDALDGESAGILLDLACALIVRLDNGRQIQSEEVLPQLPQDIRSLIRLPRSDAYNSVLQSLSQNEH